jgi:hypothetical protein
MADARSAATDRGILCSMTTRPEHGTGLFRIAEDTGLAGVKPGTACAVEVYENFFRAYQDFVAVRDAAAKCRFAQQENEFRTYIPFGLTAFQIASQVVWYYDEVITLDPLTPLAVPEGTVADESVRAGLVHNYHVLSRLRRPIEDGYVQLLKGKLSDPNEPIADEVTAALTPEAIAAFDDEVEFGFLRTTFLPSGQISWTEARLETAFTVRAHAEGLTPGAMVNPIPPGWGPGSHLPPISRQELGDEHIRSQLDHFRQSYPREAMAIVHKLRTGTRLGAGVLFDRRSNAILANNLCKASRPDPGLSLSLALPYVDGVPVDTLTELRHAMPEAFREFRRRLADVAHKGSREGMTQQDLNATVEREVTPQLRLLSSEMEAAARKARIIGYGASSLVAVGSMGALLAGALPPVVIGAAATGLIPAISAAAEYAHKERQLRSNPFFFLWNARR